MPSGLEVRTFDVRLFPVVQIKIPEVSAASPVEAITSARLLVENCEFLRRLEQAGFEFADEYSHFLVDVVGDEDFSRSQFFYSSDDPSVTPLRQIVEWADSGRDPFVLEGILTSIRELMAITV